MKYSVTLAMNDDSGRAITVYQALSQYVTPSTPPFSVKVGKTFIGWSLSATGGQIISPGTVISITTKPTLYARYST